MAKGKVAGSSKTAQKSLNADIRPDAPVADMTPLASLGDVVSYTTSLPIVPIKDSRQHPDRAVAATVANMVFAGMTQETICRVLKIGMDTLYKHYKHELDTGQSAMVNRISESLAQRALAGSDTAAIFLLKTRGGGKFTERQNVELSGSVEVTHKAALVTELSGLIARGITIDAEPEPEKKEAPEGAPSNA